MKHFLLFLLMSSTSFIAVGQPIDFNKKKFIKIFYEKPNKDTYAQWITCNHESAYFKNDTINMFNYPSVENYDCCTTMTWNLFHKSNEYTIKEGYQCYEPGRTIETHKLGSVIIIENEAPSLFILFKERNKVMYKYRILSLIKKGDGKYQITLIRL